MKEYRFSMYELILLAVQQKRERLEKEKEQTLLMAKIRGIAARRAQETINAQRNRKRRYQKPPSVLSSPPPSSYLTSTAPLDTEA